MTWRVFRNTTPPHHKEWQIRVRGDRIEVRYGRIGKTLRMVTIPPERWLNARASDEIARRIRGKLMEGYREVEAQSDNEAYVLRLPGHVDPELTERITQTTGIEAALLQGALVRGKEPWRWVAALAAAIGHGPAVMTDDRGQIVDPREIWAKEPWLADSPDLSAAARDLGVAPQPLPDLQPECKWF